MDFSSLENGTSHLSITDASSPPIVSSYNDRIRPLLDTVDKLRRLKVTDEGIQLPTIVVVGDQSYGKSSVLESLAGISLPRGDGICTRVPLVMRLQNEPNSPVAKLSLEYHGKEVQTDEENISDAIKEATVEIAGKGKGISNNPLTLVVKRCGVPDLTMVDLPGITRNAVQDQPKDIYEQISRIIMEYITPEQTIILNVLSAAVDFSTCESIRMSQMVDKTGQRTLAVVTKADKWPEGLREKVSADDVNIGLGYVIVRNRIGDETYVEAREEEAKLFATHPLLSKIDKSIVGIPVLAEKLVKIQAGIIVKCLPEIIRKISDKLAANVDELSKLPKHMTSVADAVSTFMQVVGSSKESLKKILLEGDFVEYPDDLNMHCKARIAELLNKFSEDLKTDEFPPGKKFLQEEIEVLNESRAIGLPNFLPRAALLAILQNRVMAISPMPLDFVNKIWSYVETAVLSVVSRHLGHYPQLLFSMRRAVQNLIEKKKKESTNWVKDVLEMEKLTDYTCSPEYMTSWNKLMSHQDNFEDAIKGVRYWFNPLEGDETGIDVSHLRGKGSIVQDAFDVKMRIAAYWEIVLRRMVDNTALHLVYAIQKMVERELETEIAEEVMGKQGDGMQMMLEESPTTAEKRKKLEKSIGLLQESKKLVSKIMFRDIANVN